MRRREAREQEARVVEVQCKYCAKTINTAVDKNDLHSGGWKLITKESDDCVESFYLCPHCFSRYRGGEEP